MPPTNIGSFQILGLLGRGGMGEVFRARDTRLDRLVAIKSLPPHFLHDQDRVARFEREARVLASLSHPGIAAIHGLEEADGQRYLVLEFVEGETLADRLARGAIPIAESLAIAKQVAAALEAAHEKGVVHRDLKPGNLMVTAEGTVKVLDFGLARTDGSAAGGATQMGGASMATATSPALVQSPTMPGAILGTAGYMSPEQIRGKAVDKRVDIFAFGCVLFEMLAGKPPFLCETVAESLAATLHKEAELGSLPPETPRRIRDLLASCLAKDRNRRLRDIGDALLEIDRALADPAEPSETARARAGVPRLIALTGAAIACAVGALVGAIAFLPRDAPAGADLARPVLRATLALPREQAPIESARALAVSPDGTRIVLALADGTERSPPRLVLRDLAQLEFTEPRGTEGASFPFWSPDGMSIAFFAGARLKRLDLADGIVRTLCEAPAPRGGSWGSQGTIVFAPSAVGPLSVVQDSGGTPEPVTNCPTPGEIHRLPHMLPDDRGFIYLVANSDAPGVYHFDHRTRESRFLFESETEAVFVAPGFLAFARDEVLYAQRFDLDRLELTGSPVTIASGVQYVRPRGYLQASIAPQGTLVYQQTAPHPARKLEWIDRDGARTALPIDPLAVDLGAPLSIDARGRRAVIAARGVRGEETTEIIDLERGVRVQLGDPRREFVTGTVWSPDESGVICTVSERGDVSIAELSPGGGRRTILESEPGVEYWPGSVARTGSRNTLLYTRSTLRDKRGDIMMLDLDGEPRPAPFIRTEALDEIRPLVSPANNLVAFAVASGEEAERRLMVASFPTPGAPTQVTAASVRSNYSWLSETELCWTDDSGRVWSATITPTDGGIEVGAPQRCLGGIALDPSTSIVGFDAARSRFLAATQVAKKAVPEVTVLSDWRAAIDASQPNGR